MWGAAVALWDSRTSQGHGPPAGGSNPAAPGVRWPARAESRATPWASILRVRERAACVAVEGSQSVVQPFPDRTVPFGCEFRQ